MNRCFWQGCLRLSRRMITIQRTSVSEEYMIIFLWGEDAYRSREHLRLMQEKFKRERDPSGYNMVVLDATDSSDAARIVTEIHSAPFLADRRMVVVERVFKAKKDIIKDLMNRVEEQTFPESTIVVFWDDAGVPKGKDAKDAKALHERLQQEKFAQSFDRLEGAKMEAWVALQAKERELELPRDVMRFLVDESHGDTWQVAVVLDQVQAYVVAKGKRPVAINDIQLFLGEHAEDNIFALVDAIMESNATKAYTLLKNQYAAGDDAGRILAMIVRQFRIFLELRDTIDRLGEAPPEIIAKQLDLHPYVAKKSLAGVRRYSAAELRRVYAELLEDDVRLKRGYAEAETILESRLGQLLMIKR